MDWVFMQVFNVRTLREQENGCQSCQNRYVRARSRPLPDLQDFVWKHRSVLFLVAKRQKTF